MSELVYHSGTRSLGIIILTSWLIVGTLDMTAAIIQTLIAGGDPVRMMQFIASGIFGSEAFTARMPYALLGFIFHYVIAMGWTLLFFYLYPRVDLFFRHPLISGVTYGILVWLVMNRLVLPLANTPPLKFALGKAIVAALILIAAIGLPLALMARRYYRRQP